MAKPKTTTAPDPTRLADLMPATPDGQAERLAELKRLFPDLFTNEGRLDPGELKRLVEPTAANETERYEFKWYGKAASKREAFTPTTATLVYDEGRSVNPEKADGNLIIEGENLEVLKLLLNAYREKVKCIYIDPPYNADADVIYTDNFAIKSAAYWELTGDSQDGVKLTSSPEMRGRRHSDWLSMMQSRLLVSRQLLTEEGVIFCSIDEKEYGNLIRLFGETFGFENLVGTLVWKGATDNNPTRIAVEHEYVICFAKNLEQCATPWKNASDETKEVMLSKYQGIASRNGVATEATVSEFRKFIRDNFDTLQPLTHYAQIDDRGPYTGSRKVHNPKPGGYFYDVIHKTTGHPCTPPANGYRFPRDTMDRLLGEDRVIFGADHNQIIQIKEYLEDYEAKLPSVINLDSRSGANELEAVFGDRKLFPNPKPTKFLEIFLEFVLSDGGLFLDFFAGSGSSIHALLNNRNVSCSWIGVQIPESTPPDSPARRAGLPTISSLTIERVKRVIEGYGPDPQPIPDAGFKVYRLQKSNFPRCEFRPDPDLSETENVEALRHYIDEKEAAHLAFLDGAAERAVFDEVLLKNGFRLDWTRERRDDFPNNTIYRVSDGEREALVCLAWSERLHESTLKRLRERSESGDAPFFICLERSLDTTTKWNLKHLLGKHLVAF